jgi:hypothetical protein
LPVEGFKSQRFPPLSPCLAFFPLAHIFSRSRAISGEKMRIAIEVSAPAGPPPLGAPVETSIPFAQGKLGRAEGLVIISPDGRAAPTQLRPALIWPDGSIRWLFVIFEAVAGPGKYYLTQGEAPVEKDLLKETSDRLLLDTGELLLKVPLQGECLWQDLRAPQRGGKSVPILRGKDCDLLLTRQDGKIFRASRAGDTRKVIIEERGPIRLSVRIEGKCRAEDGEGLFDFILRLQAYRGRPELWLSVTWINATDNPGEQLRDIRFAFPYRFAPDRLVMGCENGVYDAPFRKKWPTYILQEAHDWYWAKTVHPDGRLLNLASGGCHGEHFPGWLYLTNLEKQLSFGVYVPNFWQEYPNEIDLQDSTLSVGLWPERAAERLASQPQLPSSPEGELPYRNTQYWPVMPHPYLAFFDAASKCLDVPQGMAKTQEIMLSGWAGASAQPSFEKKWWGGTFSPIRGLVDPRQAAKSQAVGPCWPKDDKHFPDIERMYEESFEWFIRHVENLKCYGKFDYGDFHYFTAATDYLCHSQNGWEEIGEMPREGYWHNNERDVLRGLLLYYLRTGDIRAWRLGRTAARHLLEVDIRHYPHWGMYTHGYGHCYAALGVGGEADHSWLLGLLEWAGISGDALAWEWILKCGDYLAAQEIDFSQSNIREISLLLHMLVQFYRYTGDNKYLQASDTLADVLLQSQNKDGGWCAYMDRSCSTIVGFVEHAALALADYYSLTGTPRVLAPLKKALLWCAGKKGRGLDVGEGPLAMYGYALAGEKTGEALYTEQAEKGFQTLIALQNLAASPLLRGDWTLGDFQVNNPALAAGSGRPRQFTGQTRPLCPSGVLAYTPAALELLAKSRRLTPPKPASQRKK